MTRQGPRRPVKKKKPKFMRTKAVRLRRVGERWRRPRGVDSKMRLEVLGKPMSPKAGYGGDRRTRGMHPSGYLEVLVHNEGDVESLDPSTQAARISSKVGLLKREKILARADELRIRVLNR